MEDSSKENEIDGLSLQHVLKLINQPKISDEDACAVYPDTAKVLKNWTLTIRENPVQKVSTAPIDNETRVGLHDHETTSDYASMIKFYCCCALATGCRGDKAMWGLKERNLSIVE